MSFGLIPYGHQNASLCHAEFFPIRTQHPKQKEASTTQPRRIFLDSSLVGKRGDGLGGEVGKRDGAGLSGAEGLALDGDGNAVSLGLLLGLGVRLHSLQEVLSRSRGGDVLDSDVDSLLDVAVLDLLVDDDTDGSLGDIVDDTSLAVVDLVGHTVVRC